MSKLPLINTCKGKLPACCDKKRCRHSWQNFDLLKICFSGHVLIAVVQDISCNSKMEGDNLLTHVVLQGRLGHATALPRAVAKAASPCTRKANSCQLALLASNFSIDGVKAKTLSDEQLVSNPAHAKYGSLLLACVCRSQL